MANQITYSIMAPKPVPNTDKGKTDTPSGKKLDLVFRLQVAGVRQTTYATVVEAICMFIQSTYDQGYDVSDALENLTPTVLPVPVMQSSPGATDEDKVQWPTTYRGEHSQYLRDKALLKSNMYKAYALIYSKYCSDEMQHHIGEEVAIDSSTRTILLSYCPPSSC